MAVARDEGCLTYPVGCEADVYRMVKAAAQKANQDFHHAHDSTYSMRVLAFSCMVGMMFAYTFYRPGQNQEDASSDSEPDEQANLAG